MNPIIRVDTIEVGDIVGYKPHNTGTLMYEVISVNEGLVRAELLVKTAYWYNGSDVVSDTDNRFILYRKKVGDDYPWVDCIKRGRWPPRKPEKLHMGSIGETLQNEK